MVKTTVIDLMARRLPDSAEEYPPWTLRCTWLLTEGGDKTSQTFHEGTDERVARNLACFVLDRYRDLDMRKLAAVEVRMPDGTWENVPRPTGRVTAPVRFAFQRRPGRPGQRPPEVPHSYL